MVEFSLKIRAVGKGRPRLNKGVVYTPSKTKQYENNIRIAYSYFYNQAEREIADELKKLYLRPLSIDITFHYIKAKSCREKYMTKKPDIDNIAKSTLDSLNRILYNDDSQIVELSCRKIYNNEEKIVIKIKEYKDE